MKKIRFSQHFGLKKSQLELDFVDITINDGDLPLFIDPFAIHHRIDRFSIDSHNTLVAYFQLLINVIREDRDAEALALLSHLQEPNTTRLGLSKGSHPRGRGIGDIQAGQLLAALKKSKAVRTGFLKDLEDCALLIDGIGSDKISDITTNVIRWQLIKYTVDQCALWNIKLNSGVYVGNIWNREMEGWEARYGDLPVCKGFPVILVPKAIARIKTQFEGHEYYRMNVLPYLQAEHMDTNSNLTRLLKSGERRPPTKKTLEKHYPYSKDFLFSFSKDHPDVLEQYKEHKNEFLLDVSNEELTEVQIVAGVKTAPIDISSVLGKLASIPSGKDGADEYHNHMYGILTSVFYPDLIYPKKEQPVDSGRKRVDITFQNYAKNGFFRWLSNGPGIPCAYIHCECKNYEEDPANPDLDQLTGRFSANMGQFGFLLCRTIKDKDQFYTRCRYAALKRQQYVIPLDDVDVKQILYLAQAQQRSELYKFLDDKFRCISM